MSDQIYMHELSKGDVFRYGDDAYTMTIVSRTKYGTRYKTTDTDRPIYYHNHKFPKVPVTIISKNKKHQR